MRNWSSSVTVLMWELTHLGSGDLVVEVGAYFWWEERKDLREEVEEDRIKALV